MKDKNGYDYDECCYQEMTKSVGGQSTPQPYWNEPLCNDYEMNKKSFYGPNGFDWSGMRKEK